MEGKETKDVKVRTNILITRELKKQVEEEAKKQNRSFNNLVITVLQEYLKSATDPRAD